MISMLRRAWRMRHIKKHGSLTFAEVDAEQWNRQTIIAYALRGSPIVGRA